MIFAAGQMVLIGERPEPRGVWVPEMNQTVGTVGFVRHDAEEDDDNCSLFIRYSSTRREDFWNYPVSTLTAISEDCVSKADWWALVNS